MVKLSNSLQTEYKKKYINLFKKFKDVFPWSYEDMKNYDTFII